MNKDITFNSDALSLGIGIMELPLKCVVVISEGIVKGRKLSDYGEYKIFTHQGKVRRMKRDEGEEF